MIILFTFQTSILNWDQSFQLNKRLNAMGYESRSEEMGVSSITEVYRDLRPNERAADASRIDYYNILALVNSYNKQ